MIKKDCKWYELKSLSIGDANWCQLYDEELIEDANDCDDTECENYSRRHK